jgi:hypothetical protein
MSTADSLVILPPKRRSNIPDLVNELAATLRGQQADKDAKARWEREHALDRERTAAQVDLYGAQRGSAVAQTDETRQKMSHAQAELLAKSFVEATYAPLIKAGKVAEATAAARQFTAHYPEAAVALRGHASGREATDADYTAQNTAKFTRDQTGIAAGGSQDAQARNLTTKLATGDQLTAQAFGDQRARQTTQPGLADAGTDYGKAVRVDAELAPTANARLQASTQIQIGRENNAAQLKAAGMRGSAVADRPSSAIEKRSLGFYLRAKDAVDQLESDYKGQPLHEKVGLKDAGGQLWASHAPNLLQPEENQLYRQAQRQFTEARLRKDSGAAIPEHEFVNDRKTYFAQPGDTPDVIARKRLARENLLASLKMESGRAYAEHYGDAEQGVVTTPDGKKWRAEGGRMVEVQ